jgi:hypothetical protein
MEGKPCQICGSVVYETRYSPSPDDWEEGRVCAECGAPEGEQIDTFDWSLYIMVDGDASLYDLRYGVHDLVGLMLAIRRALLHGDVEVKVSAR